MGDAFFGPETELVVASRDGSVAAEPAPRPAAPRAAPLPHRPAAVTDEALHHPTAVAARTAAARGRPNGTISTAVGDAFFGPETDLILAPSSDDAGAPAPGGDPTRPEPLETEPTEAEPTEAEPTEAEAAVAEVEPTEAEPPAAGRPPPTGAPATVEEWQQATHRAADALPRPAVAGGAGSVTELAERSAERTDRTARATAVRSRRHVPRPPRVPPPPAPPPDPVPEATRIVREAADATLPPVELPPVHRTPRGRLPVLPESRLGDLTAARLALRAALTPPEPVRPPARTPTEPEVPETAPESDPAPVEPPPRLEDIRVPELPALPEPLLATVGQVVDRLRAELPDVVRDTLHQARTDAYPNSVLADSTMFNTHRDDVHVPELTTTMTAEVDQLAASVGYTEQYLGTATTERHAGLDQSRQQAGTELAAAATEATQTAREAAEQAAATITKAQRDAERETTRRLRRAMTSTDPQLVTDVRDELLARARTEVNDATVTHRQAGQRRTDQIADYERRYVAAYEAADAADMRAAGEGEGGMDVNRAPDGRPWLDVQRAEVAKAMRGLQDSAERSIRALVETAESAGRQAPDLIRQWAADRLGELRDEDTRRWEAARDEDLRRRDLIEAEARAAGQRSRDQLLLDVLTMQAAVARQATGTAEDATTADEYLTAVANAAGTEADQQLGWLTGQLRQRMAGSRQDALKEQLRKDIEDVKPNAGNYDALDKILFEGLDRTALWIANRVHDAVDRWGTEEQWIYDALAGLTPAQAAVVGATYLVNYEVTIEWAIRDDMSGAEMDRALALARGDRIGSTAARLRDAMAGPGTNEAEVYAALRGLSAEDRAKVDTWYRENYGESLDDAIRDDFSGQELERAQALLAGDETRADALALDEAVVGRNVAAMESVHAQIRADVAAAFPEHTSEQLEAEVRRRTAGVEVSYDARFGPAGRTLRQAYERNLRGPAQDLAEALRTNDVVGADAARLALAGQRAEAADMSADSKLNAIFQARFERQLDAVRRDHEPRLRAELADRIRNREQQGSPMSGPELAIAERNVQADLERLAQERAKDGMSTLERRFDARYTQVWGRRHAHGGYGDGYGGGYGGGGSYGGVEGGLQTLLAERGREEARAWGKEGYLTPAQQVRFAVTGRGTDEDRVRRALQGRTREEIEAILADYRERYPGEDMRQRLHDETDPGTRDRFDFDEALRGLPRTDEEQWEAIQRRQRFETTTYGAGGRFEVSPQQRAILDAEYERAEQHYKELTDPNRRTSPQETARMSRELARVATRYDAAAEAYRAGVDRVTEAITQIVTIVVVVVVTAVLLFASGGTAAPALVALAASLWGTAATMATKAILLGTQYGLEDASKDLALGAVDAALSVATAGIGPRLLTAAKGVPPGALARMAASGSRAARVTARAGAEVISQAAQAGPSGLAMTLLDDNTYRGDVLKNVLEGTVRAAGTNLATGLAAGAAMRAGASIGRQAIGAVRQTWRTARGFPPPDAVAVVEGTRSLAAQRAAAPGRPADVLGLRGTPAQRAAAFREFRGRYPRSDYRDFLRALDEGSVAVQAAADAAHQAQRQMRRELLSVVPPPLRGRFGRTPIEVVSDADFAQRTRSARGNAVVEFHQGEPRVIVRESAPPGTLLREGAHLWQAVEPRTAALIRRLDESVLGSWDTLTVAEKMRLYRAKLDLEIDAHRRTVRFFQDQLADPGLGPHGRARLAMELDVDLRTLDNLRRIRGDVVGLRRDELARIARGELRSPVDLDQPSRLFSKTTTTVPDPPNRNLVPDDVQLVTDTPQHRNHGRTAYQVGPSYAEAGRGAQTPWYRRVMTVDQHGRRRLIEENWMPDGRWVESGSSRAHRGARLETAVELFSERLRQRAARLGTAPYFHFPQEWGRGGFDRIGVRFYADGTARLRLIEVKRSKSPTFGEFTAITENLEFNLLRIRHQLIDMRAQALAGKTPHGMSLSEIDAALTALTERRIDVQIVIGPEGRIGPRGTARSLLDRIAEDVNARLGTKDVRVLGLTRIGRQSLADAEVAEHLGRVGREDQRLTVLAARGRVVGPEGLREAKAVLHLEGSGTLAGPVHRSPVAGVVYYDGTGHPVHVARPVGGRRFDAGAEAERLLAELRHVAPLEPPARSLVARKVVLDTGALTARQRELLRQVLRRQAARANATSLLANLIDVEVRT